MTTSANVILWGTHIGTAALLDGERFVRFEYAPDFIGSGIEVSPLRMPLSGGVFSFPQLNIESFHGLPGLLADSLPDKFGNAVIDSWLESQGRPPGSLNPIERLCYTGSRGMGALEYIPSLGPAPTTQESLQVDRLVELSSKILTRRKVLHISEKDQAMEQIIRVGTSAGGARAKAVIAWSESTGDIQSGQVPSEKGYSHWIIKFDGVSGNRDKENYDGPQYTTIEYAYYLMAREAGVEMSECRLYEENGLRHFMTRRFDRTSPDGGKLHMQTLAALGHFDFNRPGACSYEQAAGAARRLGLGQHEIEALFRRMVFNVAARNQDDHVKNISFLMDRRGSWSLAPAYDVTYAYNPDGQWTCAHQMSVNGKLSDITKEDCLATARHMSIKAPKAKEIMEEVTSAVLRWNEFAQKAELSERKTIAIGAQLAPLA